MRFPLRPYQARAVEEAREAYRQGKRSILLVAPTGAGKTRIGVEFVTAALAKGGKVLWLAHREELLEQARERLLEEGLPHVGIINANSGASMAPVHVASIQTIVARSSRGVPPASVVVFDEAHHYAASTYRVIAGRYASAAKLGLTATPERGDGAALGDLFDHMILVSSVAELQELGVLVPCKIVAASGPTQDLSSDPVASYLAHTPGERTFVFCTTVAHAERVALNFAAKGIPAAPIQAKTPWLLRKARIEAFRTQDAGPLLKAGTCEAPSLVLTNVYALTEGVDVPAASHCIVARGCGHVGMWLQMIGRVLRASPGKERAVVSDLRGSVHRLKLPEFAHKWSLTGKAIDEEQERAKYPDRLKTCPACSGVYALYGVDRDGWSICPHCRERLAPPQAIAVAAREQHVMGTGASPDVRSAYLRQMACVAARRGFKAGWLAWRYQDKFGRWPPKGASEMAIATCGVPIGTRTVGYDDDERAAIQGEV